MLTPLSRRRILIWWSPDVEMPRMTGFDLTAKIRADKKLSETPVNCLVTALDSQ